MNCDNFQEMLALQVSGDLPAGQARRLETHLHDCPDCRKLEERLRAGRQTLIGLAAAEAAPVSIRSGVLERISAEPRPSTGIFPGWKLAGAATAAVLLLALILVQFLPDRAPAQFTADTAPQDLTDTGPLPQIEETPPTAVAVPTAETVTAAVVTPDEPAPAIRPESPIVPEPANPPPPAEAVVVKMLTDDPDVVIYMLVEGEGDPQNA